MEALKKIYNFFYSDKKERVEMVLEPLQAMTQLAIMTYCPIGSKLSISNNLLCIQIPSWSQSVTRSYNHDKKDDLFFLFSVINRFNSFYLFLKNKKEKTKELFDLIIEMSKSGLDKIIQTYTRSGSDYTHLLQTLKMYRKMLERPEIFIEKSNDENKSESICLNNEIDKNIDGIFIKISKLYNEEHLNIIFNTLKLIQKYPEDCITYMNGLNCILNPIYTEIKKWIHENIIF